MATSDNDIEINSYITKLAQTLSIDENSIRSEFRKYIRMHKKDKFVNTGNNINIANLSLTLANASVAAERQLIRLMCEDSSIIPYVMADLSSEDFSEASRQEIINSLLAAYNRKKEVAPDSLGDGLSDTAMKELSQIMFLDQHPDDITRVVDDCVRAVRLARLRRQCEQQRSKVEELERMGDSRYLQELAEIQRINDEITKLYNA